MACDWNKVTLGRTGLSVVPLGLAPSQHLAAREVERAFERGINYLYWGTQRRPGFGRGIRNIARRHRDQMVVVVQSYSRMARLIRPSLELALKRLGLEYTDVLLLGLWNTPPPRRIVEAAMALRDAGKARHIMISCHDRPTFEHFINDPAYGAIMVRYSAAHTGAEREVFPLLGPVGAERPGVVTYTATRWGTLIDPRFTPPGENTPRPSDCYRFALSNPDVNVCIAGPKDATQLDEAMAALDRGPMSDAELIWMERVGQQVRASPKAVGNVQVQLLDRARAWLRRIITKSH